MHDNNGKRFINSPHHQLCNTGRTECKVTTQFGRTRARRGWSAMWIPRSMNVTILQLLWVVLETLADNLFGLKRNGNKQIWQFWRALHFADANRWDQVVFEFDSSTLVQALSSPGYGDSEFYTVVSSIIYQLYLHSNFEVKFVRR